MKRISENSPRRQKKRGYMPSVKITVLICVLVFIVAAAGALMAPGLKVNEILCEGCVNLNQTDIIGASQISLGENIFLTNTGSARRHIEEMPFVGSAEVKRIFPNKIKITVFERVPAGYVPNGAECALIDSSGVVLEIIEYETASAIEEYSMPKEEAKGDAAQNNKEEDAAENGKHRIEETPEEGRQDQQETEPDESENANAENSEGEQGAQADEKTEQSEDRRAYSVPFIKGVNLKNAEVGKTVSAESKEKLGMVLSICNALYDAGLLERATFLDAEDEKEVRLIIENRIDIRLGAAENMEYRAKFIAEVINTNITAYEHVIMDYHGDDVYVRSPEDGKDRMVKKQSDNGETDIDADGEEESSKEDKTDENSTKEERSANEESDRESGEETTDTNDVSDQERGGAEQGELII